MQRPFLEVLTRVYKRPEMLIRNQESLRAQTDSDWIQSLFVDDLGRGIGWSYTNLSLHGNNLKGDYIWILDDDDICTLPTFVSGLKEIVTVHGPDVIMVRMDHGDGRILPDDRWGLSPRLGELGVSAFVVERELWKRHAWAMNPGHYSSDFTFIYALWQARPAIYWWDVIASATQQRQSFGRARS